MAALQQSRVLIVEDSREKANAIRDCLAEIEPQYDILATQTILIAGQLLEQERWAGIVLDLAFHRSEQTGDLLNRPYLAGLEILQQINQLRLDVPVIIATQHSSFINTKYGDFHSIEELCEMLRKAFPQNFKELIEVDLGGSGWRTLLVRAAKRHFR